MKRFHVHVAVNDLDASIRFYSTLFGIPPTVEKPDYAKWMVDDPRINFAISSRGSKEGLNHFGFQLDTDEEFRAMHAQLASADAGLVEEIAANCCYAKSDKYWVTDPSGIAWETYHSLGSIPMFGSEEPSESTSPTGCCTPEPATGSARIPVKARSGCCS
jgi:catechol 2,3-dioxygenase-like lactoylglutathione lyase family enzyme